MLNEKKHLYQSKDNLIHECGGAELVDGNENTYVVWTKCGFDVPHNKSFKNSETITCPRCLQNE